MRIFVAGGSGALGVPLVRALARNGTQVTALTRTPGKRPALEALGAAVAVADVFDVAELDQALRAAAPTHVVNLLTALPKQGPMKPSDLDATNRLRTEGTRNLLRASVAAGARRLIAESFVYVYGFGDHGTTAKTEDGPFLGPHRSRGIQEGVDAMRALERQVLDANARGEIEGVILRYGGFYGADSESTRSRIAPLRRRKLPVIRHDPGLIPFIHQDDGVAATIAALDRARPGGVYNVVDDQSISLSEFTRIAASYLGAPPPRAVPFWVLKWTMPYFAAFAGTRLVLSNARAKTELGWRPGFPTCRDGLREVVGHFTNTAAR